jgi:peptidoglycan/xylan/chitin deacetylase (PgdA/CDA1 family)
MSFGTHVKPLVGNIARRVIDSATAIMPGPKPVVFRLPRGKRQIALTFDDGPHPEYTPKVLETLDRFRARATFFVVGDRVIRYPNLVRWMLRSGHALGNHSYSHPHFRSLSVDECVNECDRTDAAILEACPGTSRCEWVRPPWASLSLMQGYRLWTGGRRIALWSVACGDRREGSSPDDVYRSALRARAGDVVLLHDASPLTADVLGTILQAYRQRGIEVCALQ